VQSYLKGLGAVIQLGLHICQLRLHTKHVRANRGSSLKQLMLQQSVKRLLPLQVMFEALAALVMV
jgi:hypothetical protein